LTEINFVLSLQRKGEGVHIMMQVEMSTDFSTVLGKDSASYTILKKELAYFINFIIVFK